MGAQATCCSATEVEGRPCCKNGSPANGFSDEVMGVEPTAPPGVGLKASLEPSSASERFNLVKNVAAADDGGGADASGGHIDGSGSTEAVVGHIYEDGSKYTGQLVDGLRHGEGARECSSGSYEGQWEADKQHGTGKQLWADGRTFEGQFSLGKFDGHGRMVWHTQKGLLVYEGQYEADLKSGTGKFSWGDGRIYDGEWCRGMRHGRGTYTNAAKQEKVGYWVEDKFDHWGSSNDVKPCVI